MTTETSDLSYCIFQRDWWLDAVAPGAWAEARLERGGRLVARMPFVPRSRAGERVLGMPEWTQTLGPWIAPSLSANPAERNSDEIECLKELINRLPEHDYLEAQLHSCISNALPFYWTGCEILTRYSYVLKDLSNMDLIWGGMKDTTRNRIRKAQEKLSVSAEEDMGAYLELWRDVFKRRSIQCPSEAALIRINEACAMRDQRRILFARDGTGRPHAALFLVWDQNSAYYLSSGSNADGRQTHAVSLLLWEAIRFASTRTKEFNFEGSMIPSIESFFRSFGAVARPYWRVEGLTRRTFWNQLRQTAIRCAQPGRRA